VAPMERSSEVAGGSFAADPHAAIAMQGEEGLVAAVLRQLLIDIAHPRPTRIRFSSSPTIQEQISALEFALDVRAIALWTDLVGLDAHYIQEQILCAVGIGPADTAPRLGQRRAPLPSDRGPYKRERTAPKAPNSSRLGRSGDARKLKPTRRKKTPHVHIAPDHRRQPNQYSST
jgi:hypothetical protein